MVERVLEHVADVAAAVDGGTDLGFEQVQLAEELGLDKSEPVLGQCLKSPFKDKMAPSIISTEEKQLAFGLSLSLNVPLF